MTLKQFIDKIGNYTDENIEVVVRTGMNGYDDGRLCNFRSRVKNRHYLHEYDGWVVSFFNIIDGKLVIQMNTESKSNPV